MTMKIPPRGLADYILSFFGKKRAFCVPKSRDSEKSTGKNRYNYSEFQKEPFFNALIRSQATPLPDGLVYWDNLISDKKIDFQGTRKQF